MAHRRWLRKKKFFYNLRRNSQKTVFVSATNVTKIFLLKKPQEILNKKVSTKRGRRKRLVCSATSFSFQRSNQKGSAGQNRKLPSLKRNRLTGRPNVWTKQQLTSRKYIKFDPRLCPTCISSANSVRFSYRNWEYSSDQQKFPKNKTFFSSRNLKMSEAVADAFVEEKVPETFPTKVNN